MPIAQRGTNFPELVDDHAAPPRARRLPVGSRADACRRSSPSSSRKRTRCSRRSTPTMRAEHCEELGDLLFQIVFQAELRAREGKFGIEDVVRAIATKMIRRHPHVFGDLQGQRLRRGARQLGQAQGGGARGEGHPARHARRRAASNLPALLARAAHRREGGRGRLRLAGRRGRARKSCDEELREIDEAMASGDREQIEHEVGDLLFAAEPLVGQARRRAGGRAALGAAPFPEPIRSDGRSRRRPRRQGRRHAARRARSHLE